jgi:hypothetical protein
MSLTLTKKLVLVGNPCLARGIQSLMEDLHQQLRDGTEDPRQHNVVKAVLVRRVVNAVRGDVDVHHVTMEGDEEKITPVGVDGARGDGLQDDLDHWS